eukprot:7058534-Pyramimonas_sp.AAC.1
MPCRDAPRALELEHEAAPWALARELPLLLCEVARLEPRHEALLDGRQRDRLLRRGNEDSGVRVVREAGLSDTSTATGAACSH